MKYKKFINKNNKDNKIETMQNLQNENSTSLNDIFETKRNSTSVVSNEAQDVEIITYSSKPELFILIFEYVASVQYFICFLANLTTIAAVVKYDYLHRKSTNILILSLSIADGMLGKIIYLIKVQKR